MSTQLTDILHHHWGYSAFRPLQEDIIRTVLEGDDCLALLPTGGGKSVCFQVPALAREGVCLVVSPLIALMKDQVFQLQQRGFGQRRFFLVCRTRTLIAPSTMQCMGI
ncbi:MAG: DEAD/DEAH box helicase [Saprospiraceae bacterium]